MVTCYIPRKRSKRRQQRKAARPRVFLEKLEQRLPLTADCYADLFAGPRLAQVDSDESVLLEGVFNALLPGSHVDLTVADWQAIADSNLNVPDFLAALQADLNLGSPAQALDANVTLSQIFNAAADAVPADGETADIHAALMNLSTDVNVSELTGRIQLGDLLQVQFPDGRFADVDVNALNLVTGAIQLFNYSNVVTTNDPVTLSGTVLNEPGVNSVELWAQVIEPPIIDTHVVEGDQFYSAAIRLKMNIDLVDIAVAGTDVKLTDMDLYIDVARAQGEVTEIEHDASGAVVTVDASHGVTNVYMGTISDALFFNRTHVINPETEVGFGTVGSVDPLLLPLLSVEARGWAEGTAPLPGDSILEFFGPFPESQTAGTSATFIANAVNDLLTSLEARVTLGGLVVDDPTGGIQNIVANVVDDPLTAVLAGVADPALVLLGTGIGEMDVTINTVVCPPTAINDAYTTAEDTLLTVPAPGVLGNDTDIDGDPLTSVLVTGPAHGTLVLNSNGSFTYLPNLNFNGADSFTYKANDGEFDSNVATVSITVSPVNDLPDARDDAYTTSEDTPLTVAAPGLLVNDTDVDGNGLTVIAFSDPPRGTVSVAPNGSLTYTPDANLNGLDTFTYTISDGQGGTDTATVRITVSAVNDAPLAANDSYTTAEDTALNVAAPGILGNDSDPDGSPLSVVLVSGPSHGTLTQNPNGSFTYTPTANYNGPDSYTYRASDGTASSNIATVSINVTPVNDAPVAANNSYTTAEDTPLTVAAPGVLGNDSDPDGNPLTAVLVSGPSHGTLTQNPNGSFTYTPAANYTGPDSYTYRASDGTASSNIATVSINVTPVNDAPAAANDSYTTAEDTPLTVAAPGVLGNDSDPEGGTLTAMVVTGPSHGTLTQNPNGSFTYTPTANYNGPDSYTYRASDGTASSNIATVSINVTPVNDAPVAANNSYTTAEDTPLTVAAPGVLGNDSDPDGNPLTAVLVSGPSHGTLTQNPNGSFTYTPAANYTGPDSYTYRASDGTLSSNIATVSINVTPVNDVPVVANDSYTTPQNTTLTVAAPGVLGNDSDPDGNPLTAVVVAGPSDGTLTQNANGSFTYTPAANYSGPDSYTYRASDGTASSNIATVSISVTTVNRAPVAGNDSYSTGEDTTLIVAAPGVLGNDSDPDGNPLTAVVVTGPSHGTLTQNPNGSFTYTPAANYNGPDSYTYRASDGTLSSNIATVSINVTPVNDAPVAANNSYTTAEDTTLTVAAPGVLGNDSDPDGNPLSAVLVTGPSHGTLTQNANGSFTYTPAANYNGPDSYTYRASDGTLSSNVATVSINVTPVNDPPVAVNDSYTTGQNTALTVAGPGVLGNDSDPEGSSLTSVLATGPANGTLVLNSNGSFTYTPASNFFGTDTFTYRASDGAASSNLATVSITVSAPQILPARLTHTADTINTYLSGNATDLTRVDYTVKSGKINSAAPGVFFYWVEVKAPAPNFTIVIDQSIVNHSFATMMGVQTGQVKMFKSSDGSSFTSFTYTLANGDLTINVTGATTNQELVANVKFDPSTTAGQTAPNPTTVPYRFTTKVNGTFVSEDGLDLKLKGTALTAGTSGRSILGGYSTPLVVRGADSVEAGDHSVFIDVSDAAQLERIRDAIQALNQSLARRGVSLTEVADGDEAEITIRLEEIEGDVLALTEDGVIVLDAGRDWYAGDDPRLIGAGQFDLETAVTHELAHAVGFEHSRNPTSVMYAELAAGMARRLRVGAPNLLPAGSESALDSIWGAKPEFRQMNATAATAQGRVAATGKLAARAAALLDDGIRFALDCRPKLDEVAESASADAAFSDEGWLADLLSSI